MCFAALALKYFAGSLKRAESGVAAVLSARVGSIGDNRLGGWYGYRASKAALNQIVHTAAIELRRGGRGPCVVAIHPGTTHTQLSERFVARRSGVVTADVTARRILELLQTLDANRSGQFLNWDGTQLPW
jgi:NAD(P)-dependent dehydrogenase (short-subunit alcohol dehydrogenase family)